MHVHLPAACHWHQQRQRLTPDMTTSKGFTNLSCQVSAAGAAELQVCVMVAIRACARCWWCAGDMLGLGALTLPSVFARLGWLPASVLLALCALGTLMSGRLFARMAQQVEQAIWPHDTQMSACLTGPWSHLAEGP